MGTFRVSFRFLAALAAISALTLPAFTRPAFGASAPSDKMSTEGHVILPPAGWIAGTPINASDGPTIVALWRAPDGSGATINVIAQSLPANITPNEFARLTLQGLQNGVGAKNVVEFKPERICNGTQDGWYIESDVMLGFVPVVAEQTIAAAQGQSYVVTYRRAASQKEDANARRALDSLCVPAR